MSPTVRKRTLQLLDASRRRAAASPRSPAPAAAAPAHHVAAMRVVDRGQRRCSSRAMYCHTSSSVQLQIGNTRKCSPGRDARVEQRPQLGPLVLRLPLAELVADARRCAPWRAPSPRRGARRRSGVEAELLDRFEQRHRLVGVARLAGRRSRTRAARDRVLDVAHDQPLAQLGDARGRGTRSPRGSCARCRCAAAGTGNALRAERLLGEPQHATPNPCRPRTAAPGVRHCAATSRRMKIASSSSQSRWLQLLGASAARRARSRSACSSVSFLGWSAARAAACAACAPAALRVDVQAALLRGLALPPPAAGARSPRPAAPRACRARSRCWDRPGRAAGCTARRLLAM